MKTKELKECSQFLGAVEAARMEDRPVRSPQPSLSGDFDDWMRLPLTRALSQGIWHQWVVHGPFRVDCLLEEFHDAVIGTRSYDDFDEDDPKSEVLQCSYLRMDENCWLSATNHQLHVFARDRSTARDVAHGLWQLFRKRKQERPPEYHLIKQTSCGIDTENILLSTLPDQSADHWSLLYGEDFPGWHTELAAALNDRSTGITLMEGPPGTGKTSYIRHLMAGLKDTHRFYFVPSSNLGVLKDSEFVDFWSDQRRWNPDRQLVVILEDAEEALFPRTHSNRAEVGVLLNITDGLLGEFLRLHIICTVNCPVNLLDPALLRPGRLVARRHFGRIPRKRAVRVAEQLGRPLPPGEDFSLAEIVNGVSEPVENQNRKVGFTA